MKTFITECRRRRVFRVAALYIVAAWVTLQVADLAIDNWGVPTEAMRYVWVAVILGIPIVLVFGWRYDFRAGHIVRTPPSDAETDLPLQRADQIILALLAVVGVAIVAGSTIKIAGIQSPDTERFPAYDIDRASIAVLPFADMSPEGNQAYFSDGIAEELLNLLARFNGLRVISRSSSFALRDAGLSTPELARTLNVAHVLEGSVRKAGSRVRITAQLIDAQTDSHLWSETYERELVDVFAIQDEISAQVVAELKVRLLGTPPASLATNTTAYDLYLRGLSLFAKRSGTGFSPAVGGGLHLLARRRDDRLRRAIGLFEQAIDSDPDYAAAHASLGLAIVSGGCGHRRCESDVDKARRHSLAEAAARRALDLDPKNADALATLGWISFERAQIAASRSLFEQVIESRPNNPLGYRWLGMSYQNEDPVRGLALVQRAFDVDPLDSTIHFDLSTALYRLNRRDEAMEVLRNRLAFDPTDSSPYGLAGQMHWFSGEFDLAIKSLYRAYREDPTRRTYLEIVGVLGNLGEADLAYEWFREIDRRTEVQDYGMQALMAFQLGEEEEAVRIVSKDYTHWYAYWLLRFTGDFDRARSLYEQGFAEMGLDISTFDPALLWRFYLDYALLLQRTGDAERASELIRDMISAGQKQIAEGVIVGSVGDYVSISIASLRALRGDTEQSLQALEQAELHGFPCAGCLLGSPHLEGVREYPDFKALISRLKDKNQELRQRLIDEGMLLTPDEVMALEDFAFDPFAL